MEHPVNGVFFQKFLPKTCPINRHMTIYILLKIFNCIFKGRYSTTSKKDSELTVEDFELRYKSGLEIDAELQEGSILDLNLII